MIVLKEELQKFRSINLKTLEESITDLPDDVRNTIALYNKAIESVSKGSEDIAIIELKKAIAINPGFHEAINLLGLCYAYVGEKEKAAELFEQVIESERNGIQAFNYRKFIGGDLPEELQRLLEGEPDAEKEKKQGQRKKTKKTGKKTRGKTDIHGKPEPVGRKKFSGSRMFPAFILGLLLGAILVFIFAYPYIFGKKNTPAIQQNTDEILQLQDEITALEEELADALDKYRQKEREHSNLVVELNEANKSIEYYTEAMKLFQAGVYEQEGRYEEAADLLLAINADKLENAEKQWHDTARAKIMKEAAQRLYQEGRSLCQDARNYEEGLKKLEKVALYDENFPQMEGLLYYTGKCLQNVGRTDEAMECYNRILEEYPNGYFRTYVTDRINEINRAAEGR